MDASLCCKRDAILEHVASWGDRRPHAAETKRRKPIVKRENFNRFHRAVTRRFEAGDSSRTLDPPRSGLWWYNKNELAL
jgi:hypothetical protein